MTERVPDDIFALYSRFDLDGEDYRVFVRAEIDAVQQVTLTSADEPIYASAERGDSSLQPIPVGFALETSEDLSEPTEASIPSFSNDPHTSHLGLRNLWRHVAGHVMHPNATSDSLALASINIHGMAGGAGVTTVAAVLARFLAKAGRRCAVIDGSGGSTLPVFFGAQRVSDDHRRFSGLHLLFEPKPRILSSPAISAASLTRNDLRDWILAETGGDFDHLIFDQPARCMEQFGSVLNLCVAVPDVSSLIGARKLKAVLNSEDLSSKTICVLNRFNSEIALHQELLGWYTDNFREVVTVADSPLVSEALAEGTTVIDWTPQAEVSMDLTRLFKAVFHLLTSKVERSPLCS